MEKIAYLDYSAILKSGRHDSVVNTQFYLREGKPFYCDIFKDGKKTLFGKEIKLNKSKITTEMYSSPKSGEEIAYDEEEAIKYLENIEIV